MLKPGERLDKIMIEAHGAPLMVSIPGINEYNAVSVASLSFLGDYAKCIDFTSCNLAADNTGDVGTDLALLDSTVLSYIRNDTEVDLNSTYGLGAWSPVHYAGYEKSHAATFEDRTKELMLNGTPAVIAEAIARSVGGEQDTAAEMIMGRGGNQYRFIPNDRNNNGIHEASEYDVVRVNQNGDCASADMPGLPMYSTAAVERLYAEHGGKTKDETYAADDTDHISMPMQKRVYGDNSEIYDQTWFRFVSRLDEGIGYGTPGAVELMQSLVRMKRENAQMYDVIKQSYIHYFGNDGYFDAIETMDKEITIMPEGAGRLLDNPSARREI